jgi:hypothetical protein
VRTPRGGSGTGHGRIALTELLKLQKSGQFPDEPLEEKSEIFKKKRRVFFIFLFVNRTSSLPGASRRFQEDPLGRWEDALRN